MGPRSWKTAAMGPRPDHPTPTPAAAHAGLRAPAWRCWTGSAGHVGSERDAHPPGFCQSQLTALLAALHSGHSLCHLTWALPPEAGDAEPATAGPETGPGQSGVGRDGGDQPDSTHAQGHVRTAAASKTPAWTAGAALLREGASSRDEHVTAHSHRALHSLSCACAGRGRPVLPSALLGPLPPRPGPHSGNAPCAHHFKAAQVSLSQPIPNHDLFTVPRRDPQRRCWERACVGGTRDWPAPPNTVDERRHADAGTQLLSGQMSL